MVLSPPGPNALLSFSHQRLLSETGDSMATCAVYVSKTTIQVRIVEHKICFRKAVQCSFLWQSLESHFLEVIFDEYHSKMSENTLHQVTASRVRIHSHLQS